MNKLYHYTSLEKAFKILLNNKFKFGHFENHNDPFENLKKRFFLAPIFDSKSEEYMDQVADFANRKISVACFGTDTDKTPGHYKPTMWAHYAEKHKGVCFVFNEEPFIKELKKVNEDPLIQKVIYVDDNKTMVASPDIIKEHVNASIEGFLRQYKNNLLFAKHRDWSVENETRMIVFKESCEISIESSLHSVVFGPEINKEDEEALNEIARLVYQPFSLGE